MVSTRARTVVCTLALAGALAACATYRDDLDRAMLHYSANEYPAALLLLEVLERDQGSLSHAEQAEYAYYRGMAHFRLGQRLHARHWLGIAAAREKAAAGSLKGEEKQRVDETLAELNKDKWGGPVTQPAGPPKCASDLDCVRGEFCDAGACKKLDAAPGKDGGAVDAAK